VSLTRSESATPATAQSGDFDIVLTVRCRDIVAFAAADFDETAPDDYSATAGFECDVTSGNVITCHDVTGGGDGLAPGEGVLIVLKVHVRQRRRTRHYLMAAADPTNATEWTDLNNDASESTGIQP
jgi:hypothetical protein